MRIRCVNLILMTAVLSSAQANPLRTDSSRAIAYRGGQGPENTLAAVHDSLALGIRLIHVDVRVTSDGVPVAFHDASLDRTTDGTGLLADRTFDEIRRLDAGKSYIDGSVLASPFEGERIPTVAEVLKTVGNDAHLILDLRVADAAEPVVNAIQSAGAWRRVTVRSDDREVVAKLKSLDAQLSVAGLLKVGETGTEQRVRQWREMEVAALTISPAERLDRNLVGLIHDLGMAAWAASTNDPRELARLIDVGVDGIASEESAVVEHMLNLGPQPLPLMIGADEPVRIANVKNGRVHPAICVAHDGTILVIYNRSGDAGKELLVTRSVDEGRSWSRPRAIPASRSCPVYPGSATTLADGRIIVTWTCCREKTERGPQLYSMSSDGGLTWSGPRSLGVTGFLRHAVLELDRDKWLFPLRDRTALFQPSTGRVRDFGDGENHGRVPIVRTIRGTLISGAGSGGLRSSDEGQTWDPIAALPRFRHTGFDLTGLAHGPVVLTSIDYDTKGREIGVRLVTSHDDGRSWDYPRSLEVFRPERPIEGRGWARTVAISPHALGTVVFNLDRNQPGGPGLFFIRTQRVNAEFELEVPDGFVGPVEAGRGRMIGVLPDLTSLESLDEGRTWTPIGPLKEADGPALHEGGAIASVQVTEFDGGLSVAWVHTSSADQISGDAGRSSETHRIRFSVSRDGGQTWSKPTTALRSAVALRIGVPLELSTDRVVIPVEYRHQQEGRPALPICSTVYSDDSGQSWSQSTDRLWAWADGGALQGGCHSPSLAELPSGQLMMSMGTQFDRVATSLSSDGGHSWNHVRLSPLRGGADDVSLMRLPGQPKVVCVWNVTSGSDDGAPLGRLASAVSGDGGSSWDEFHTIVQAPGQQTLKQLPKPSRPRFVRQSRGATHERRHASLRFVAGRGYIVYRHREAESGSGAPTYDRWRLRALPEQWFSRKQ